MWKGAWVGYEPFSKELIICHGCDGLGHCSDSSFFNFVILHIDSAIRFTLRLPISTEAPCLMIYRA